MKPPSNDDAARMLAAGSIDQSLHDMIVQANNAAPQPEAMNGINAGVPHSANPLADPNALPSPVAPDGYVPGSINPLASDAKQDLARAADAAANAPPPRQQLSFERDAPPAEIGALTGEEAKAVQPATQTVAPVAPATRVASSGAPVDAQKLGKLEQRQVDEANAAGATAKANTSAAGELAVKKAEEQTAALAVANQKQLDAAAEMADHEAKRQASMQQMIDKAEAARAEYANSKIDPAHMWNSVSTGSQIVAGIGLILGSFGQGGENRAATVFTNAINRDIEVQKANIAVKGNAIEQQRGVYADMLRKFGDERTAEAAAKLMSWEQAKAQLAVISSKYGAPESALATKVANDEIDKQTKTYATQMAVAHDANLKRQAAAVAAAAQHRQDKLEDREFELKKMAVEHGAKLDEIAAKEGGEGTELDVPGVGRAATADDAKQIKDGLASYRAANETIDRMLADRTANGAIIWNPKRTAQAVQAVTSVKMHLKDAFKLGVLSANDDKTLSDIVPDPGSITTGSMSNQAFADSVVEGLKALKTELKTRVDAQVAARMGARQQASGPAPIAGLKKR